MRNWNGRNLRLLHHVIFSQLVRRFSVGLLAVMSPGPDFVLTIRNSLVYSRRASTRRLGSPWVMLSMRRMPRWNWRNHHSLHFAV